jgi:undecaprenyl diphosphate synthase
MFRFLKRDKVNSFTDINIDYTVIPRHIAIIMDGNGRWAKKRNLPRNLGHKAGVETIREVVKECNRLGVKYLTLYAFSTENWIRPPEEVNGLMKLLVEYLKSEVKELDSNNVIVNHIGDISKLPHICQKELWAAYELTKNNTGIMLNLAINYGGRNEIVHAIKKVANAIRDGLLTVDDINEDLIGKYLYTSNIPDPDLIIRPSGEKRISNFLLWQCAYSEFWFSNINWPDFTKRDLHQAIYDFQNRDRRFGGLK